MNWQIKLCLSSNFIELNLSFPPSLRKWSYAPVPVLCQLAEVVHFEWNNQKQKTLIHQNRNIQQIYYARAGVWRGERSSSLLNRQNS